MSNPTTGTGFDDSLFGDTNPTDLNDVFNFDLSAGKDTWYGGKGDDTYYVNSTGDRAIELAGEGIDSVFSTVSYTLGANVENMTLLDVSTALNATGNASDNRLNGNAFNNTLSGMAGNDSLFGLGGNDKLNGGNGNDTLDGGIGSDLLDGGLGNDVYYVDEVGDVVNEAAGAGTDLVWSAISDTLDANVENMTLLEAAAALNATGNASNNVLTGNSLNNVLDGGAGNDTLIGGTGNDVYFIDSLGDAVSETNLAGSGTDLVISSVSDMLDANVENMTLADVATALNATGNSSNNVLTGNTFNNTLSGAAGNDTLLGLGGHDVLRGGDGADTLNGGDGNDTLFDDAGDDVVDGGAGDDTFRFSTGNDVLTGGAGADRFELGGAGFDIVTDFNHADDTFVLSDLLDDGVAGSQNSAGLMGLLFNGDSELSPSRYFEGGGVFGTVPDTFYRGSGIYVNTDTGEIRYNPTAYVSGDAILLGRVSVDVAASLDSTDFVFGG